MIDYIDSEEIVQQFLCSYVISYKNVICEIDFAISKSLSRIHLQTSKCLFFFKRSRLLKKECPLKCPHELYRLNHLLISSCIYNEHLIINYCCIVYTNRQIPPLWIKSSISFPALVKPPAVSSLYNSKSWI